MSQKSKNLILLEKSKYFQILKKPPKAQKHLKNAFHAISDHYKWFWIEKIFFDFLGPMTRFHQKCLSQDIVQAGSLILFLVYFYDSYLQHIKSCQGKVDFEMNLRISLGFKIFTVTNDGRMQAYFDRLSVRVKLTGFMTDFKLEFEPFGLQVQVLNRISLLSKI